MRNALVNEWWASPGFTVLLNRNKNTIRALEGRGLVENLRLTPAGLRVARELVEGEFREFTARMRRAGGVSSV